MAQVPPPVAKDPLIGQTIDGRWYVVRLIAQGATGMVYLAERANLGREVALKLLHHEYSTSDDFVRRFAREARAMSRLQHVNCISILDVGMHQQRPYIVMELVHGRALTLEAAGPSMTPARAVNLLRQVLLGLHHAHEHGIVHRDLKPDNIMITEQSGIGEVAKVLDFGFARMTDGRHSQSNADIVPGTPSYMSPEQAQGIKTDLRTDLYSTGVILYELCVGFKPFVAGDAFGVLQKHINDVPVPPRQAAQGRKISEGLEKVILRALVKDRDQRFANAEEFRLALEATPEGRQALSGGGETSSRKLIGWVVAVGVIVAVVAGLAVALAGRGNHPTAATTPVPAVTPVPPAPSVPAPAPVVPAVPSGVTTPGTAAPSGATTPGTVAPSGATPSGATPTGVTPTGVTPTAATPSGAPVAPATAPATPPALVVSPPPAKVPTVPQPATTSPHRSSRRR